MGSEEKKANRKSASQLGPNSDSLSWEGGVWGAHAKRYYGGAKLVLLDPELAAAFPTDDAVNDALRALLRMTETGHLPQRGWVQAGSKGRRTSPST
jgi:hypothetical protein